jgi:hypothetical protein
MSFFTGTQTECLYAMPTKGAAVTAAASTVMTLVNAGGAGGGAYILPAGYFQQNANGGFRSLLIKGGGLWSVGATAVTMLFTWNLDTTAGTALAGGLMGSTGAVTTVLSTSGLFQFELMVTCTAAGVSAGVLQTIGSVDISTTATPNSPTATLQAFGTASSTNRLLVGGVAAGLASFNTQQQYFLEMFNTWSAVTNAPSLTLTNFYVLGLN